MKRSLIVAALMAVAVTAYAAAPSSQSEYPVPGVSGGRPGAVPGFMNMWYDGVAGYPRAAGNDYPLPITGTVTSTPSGPVAVTTSPNRGVSTRLEFSLGTTATVLLAAGANRAKWTLQNKSTSATVYCTLDAATPVVGGTVGFATFPMGNSGQNGAAGSFMDTGAITCIATAAATPVYLSYSQ